MIECPVCTYRWSASDVRQCPDCGESVVVDDREECGECGAGMVLARIGAEPEPDAAVLVCPACWESPFSEENRRA